MTKKVNNIEKIVKDFFDSLKLEGTYKVEEKDEVIEVLMETEDTGMIIGYHGETLEALQLILGFCIAKETEEYKRVSIEVGDYKKNRTEWLENLARETKEKAITQEREVHLHDLKSWERRIIHLILQEDGEVESESQGEGKDRILVIKPKA